MSSSRFQVVRPQSSSDHPESSCVAFDIPQPATVRVSAGETLALLMHAARTNRAWLSDFAEETIEVSADMYEVLLAYKRIATETNARAA